MKLSEFLTTFRSDAILQVIDVLAVGKVSDKLVPALVSVTSCIQVLMHWFSFRGTRSESD